MVDLMEPLILKEELLKEFNRTLPESERKKALRDSHSRRKPIGCGITVHIGYGCDRQCAYCYIYDMNFKATVKKNPLSPKQLIYALLSNPYFVPGRNGTFLAIGSVSEPFHSLLVDATIDFIRESIETLGNPIQFSTKSVISEELIDELWEASKGVISPLITIVTIKAHKLLEPKAPSPSRRFAFVKKLREKGFKPHVFIRPVIPGISDFEADELIENALKSGAEGIVVGGFRVSENILRRLQSVGYSTSRISMRMKKSLKSGKQASVDVWRERKLVVTRALKRGLIAHFRACCANAYDHNVACWSLCWGTDRCTKCPNNCMSKLPKVSESDIMEILSHLGVRGVKLEIRENEIIIYGRGIPDNAPIIIKTLTRRRVIVTAY